MLAGHNYGSRYKDLEYLLQALGCPFQYHNILYKVPFSYLHSLKNYFLNDLDHLDSSVGDLCQVCSQDFLDGCQLKQSNLLSGLVCLMNIS